MPVWVLAFSTALFLTLAGTPVLRRLALASELVDKPGDHKSHHIPTPYLGGIAVAVGVLIGVALELQLSARVATVAFAAAALGAIGLVDDDRTVDPRYRFLAQVAAAGTATALGLRIHATGVTPIDVALTLLWIVGVTNAFNLLDNMDGLASGVAAVVAGGVFWLAIVARQPVVATMAAALVGACLGFLVYNRPPARIFLGDAGSLFVGFVVAIITIDVNPALAPPFGFIVPLALVAIPVLDTTTVTLARLRRGQSVALGRRDHLSHRLVALGLSRRTAVLALIAAQAAMAVLAVLGGRRVIQTRWTVLGAVVVLGIVSLFTSRARVYEEPVIGFPRKVRAAVGALLIAVPVISAPALLSLRQAAAPARAGHAAIIRALDSLAGGEVTSTVADFEQAAGRFREAQQNLDGPLVAAGLLVPGVSTNLEASRTLVSIGQDLAAMGVRLAAVAGGGDVRVAGGSVAMAEIRRLAFDLAEMESVLGNSQKRLQAIDRPFLLPPLQRAIRQMNQRVDREVASIGRAAVFTAALPALLGGEGPRRYFVAFHDTLETWRTGGPVGSWGELVVENGYLQLRRFGRPASVDAAGPPSTLDMPSEFEERWAGLQGHDTAPAIGGPSGFAGTAQAISELYPHAGGQPLDGVISIDPVGLSALLELTGPVTVPGWPDPISAQNVAGVVLRDSYQRFPTAGGQQRAEFLRELSQRTMEAFATTDLGDSRRVVGSLGKAVGSGHLLVQLNRSDEQVLIEGAANGALPAVQGDSVMVVNHTVSGEPIDPYLRRRLRYDAVLDPRSTPATVTSRLEVALEGHTSEGSSPAAGDGVSTLSIYTPFDDTSATLDGRPLELLSDPGLGRRSHSATVDAPALSRRPFAMDLRGEVRLSPQGWYRLDILRQAALVPDLMEATVTVPDGWRVAEARGADITSEDTAKVNVELDRPHTVWVRVERTSGWARIWDRLREH